MALRKQLTTPYQITFTATAVKVDSIAVDAENSLVHLGHSLLASDGSIVQSDRPETLSGTAYSNFNNRKNELGATMSGTDASLYVALEYLPGTGSISGDIKTLDTPYTIDGLCNVLKIESYAYNVIDRLVHIGYSKLNHPSTNLMTFIPYTLSGVEYDEFMARLDENELTMSVTNAEVTTCLENLPDAGTIVSI